VIQDKEKTSEDPCETTSETIDHKEHEHNLMTGPTLAYGFDCI